MKNRTHFLNSLIRSERGFSLLEALAVLAFVIAMSYAVLEVVSATRAQTIATTKFLEFDSQINKVRVALAQNSTCFLMLQGLNFSQLPVRAAAAGFVYPTNLPLNTVPISRLDYRGVPAENLLIESLDTSSSIINVAFEFVDFTQILPPRITLSNGNNAFVLNLTIRGRYIGRNFIDKASKTVNIPVAVITNPDNSLRSCSIGTGGGDAYMCALMDGDWIEANNPPVAGNPPPCDLPYYYTN